MSKPTPGPWKAQGGIIYPENTAALEPDRPVPDRIRASGEMFAIARVFAPERWRDGGAADVHEANACLIAAAPKMLEALRPFAAIADDYDDQASNEQYVGDVHGLVTITLGDCRAARAALRAAEGGGDER